MFVIYAAIDMPDATLTSLGWMFFRPSTIARMEKEIDAGRALVFGNDPRLDTRAKWKNRDPRIVTYTNSRRAGYSLRTVWSISREGDK